MPAEDMYRACQAIRRATELGEIPPPEAGREWAKRSWSQDLAGLPGGRSANHGWLWALCSYLRGEEAGRTYLIDRLRYELIHGLMSTEPLTGSYGGVHAAVVALVALHAQIRQDGELYSLAAAWCERYLALIVLMTQKISGHLVPLSPGARHDVGSALPGKPWIRKVEGAVISALVDRRIEFDLQPESGFWHPLLEAVRAGQERGIGRVCERMDMLARAVIRDKTKHSALRPWLDRTRLIVPLRWTAYEPELWEAYYPRGAHGQDPDKPAAAYGPASGHTPLYAWTSGEDPPERGWRCEVDVSTAGISRTLIATWTWRGRKTWTETLAVGSALIFADPICGSADPLKDLPTMPPRRNTPRPAPQPKPRPQPQTDGRKELREALHRIRDNDPDRKIRVLAHETAIQFRDAGAWGD